MCAYCKSNYPTKIKMYSRLIRRKRRCGGLEVIPKARLFTFGERTTFEAGGKGNPRTSEKYIRAYMHILEIHETKAHVCIHAQLLRRTDAATSRIYYPKVTKTENENSNNSTCYTDH